MVLLLQRHNCVNSNVADFARIGDADRTREEETGSHQLKYSPKRDLKGKGKRALDENTAVTDANIGYYAIINHEEPLARL